MEVKEAIRHILNGEAVLFLGAGFSRDAKNVLDKYMKDANGLSLELCAEMGIADNADLGAVSDYYLSDKNDAEYSKRAQKIIQKLQNNFTCKEVSEAQVTISCNKWIRIYTTNYDDVVEVASSRYAEHERTPMTMKDTVEDITNSNCVVHLNGYIRNLDKSRLEDEFKLTTRSYLIDDFNKSAISGLFYRDLREARAVVFIGTSLRYDLDIQRVLYSIDENSKKIIFIEKKKETELIDVIEDRKKNILGKVHYIGMEEFANELALMAKTYVPDSESLHLRSFEEITRKNYSYEKGRNTDIWNLYVNGNLKRDIVISHLDDDFYLIRRSVIREIQQNVERNGRTVSIIHSNLGNGKTCLMEYLMCYLSENNRVFNFCEQYCDIEKELRYISQIEGSKVVFIEDYNLYNKLISSIRFYWDETWNLVLSCRTFINNSSIHKLCSGLGLNIDQISEFDINRFTDEEKPKIVHSLKNINQAELKDIGMGKALTMLNKKGQDCWSNTVMYFFESQLIGSRIEHAFDKMSGNQNNMEIIIAAMINNIVGMNLAYNQLLTLTKISQLNLNCSRDENVAEILNIQDGRIEIKSSLLSLYLIRSKKLYMDVVRVMKNMVLNSDLLLGPDSEIVKRMLISTSNISELFYKKVPHFQEDFPKKELHKELLDYFSDICKVKYYEENEFFWLQYAMACMDMGEYSLAENNFKLAHQYEKKKNIESYQIKVQYGRFLLEKAIEYKNEHDPIKIFGQVNKEWDKVLRHDEAQKFYVYKQMEDYQKFIEIYAPQFSDADFNKAKQMIENMISTIKRFDKGGTRGSAKAEAISRLENCKKILFKNIIHS